MSEFMEEGPTHSAEDYANALKEAMQQLNISDRMKAVKTLLDSADSETLQAIIDNMEDEQLDYFLKLQSSVLDGTFNTIQEVSRLTEMENDEERSIYITYFLYFYLNFPGPNELIEYYIKKNDEIKKLYNKYKKSLTETAENITDYMKNTISDINWFFSNAFTSLPVEEQDKIKNIYANGKLLLKYNTENQSFEYDDQVTNIMMEKILKYLQEKNVRNASSLDVKTLSQSTYDSVFDKITKITDNNKKNVKEAPSIFPKKHVTESKNQGKNLIPIPVALKNQRRQRYLNKERTQKSFGSNLSAKNNLPGKNGGKSRRKIRRNEKTKTKKRKMKAKTKKRKMKTKKTKRKTNKRRTKK